GRGWPGAVAGHDDRNDPHDSRRRGGSAALAHDEDPPGDLSADRNAFGFRGRTDLRSAPGADRPADASRHDLLIPPQPTRRGGRDNPAQASRPTGGTPLQATYAAASPPAQLHAPVDQGDAATHSARGHEQARP